MTISIEKMVLDHPLYLAIRRKAPHGKIEEYIQNYASHFIPGNQEPLVIHAKKFGDADFFADMEGLTEDKRREHFIHFCNPEVFAIINEKLKSAQQPSQAEDAHKIAWSMFKRIGNPYHEDFVNAERNSARLLAKYADPTTLMLALESDGAYDIFVAQAETLSPFDDIIYTNKAVPKKQSVGTVDRENFRVFLATGKDYPLTLPVEKVAGKLLRNSTLEDSAKVNISHEFGHLITDDFDDSERDEQHRQMRELLFRDVSMIAETFNTALSYLNRSSVSENALIRNVSVRALLGMRGLDPDKICRADAHTFLLGDLEAMASTLAPAVDFRRTACSSHLSNDTRKIIQDAYDSYETSERYRAETPARLHELCSVMPRDYVAQLLPEAMERMRRCAYELYLDNLDTLNHVDRLKKGKPILIWGPESITPKSGNSR